MFNSKRIAIIGGAASGVAVLDQIILQSIQSGKQSSIGEIVILEKESQFARGLAYSTQSNSHILNMANNSMSLRPNEPNHFIDYLAEIPSLNDEEKKVTGFARRNLFGEYIQKNLLSAIHSAAAHNIRVSIKPHSKIVDMKVSDGVYNLSVNEKERQSFDKIFFCLGNQPSSALSEFENTNGYYPKPYEVESITATTPKDEDITLVGSGLTAIDTYLALREAGHTGHIKFISRQGILPKVRGNYKPYDLQFLSENNIKKLTNAGEHKISLEEMRSLFLQELTIAGVHADFINQELEAFNELSGIEILKRDLNVIGSNQNTRYLSVLKAIDNNVGHVWNALSITDQKRFDSLYKRFWDAYDYPMPDINAHQILQGLENGDLSNIGGLTGISYNSENKEYTINTMSGEDFTTKHLINTTGQSYDIKRSQDPLLQNLLQYKFITPHELGGINVDFETGRIIRPDNSMSNSLYVVGSLTRGVHFYTNSLAENVKAAQRAASHLVDSFPDPDIQIHMEKKPMSETKKIALFIGSDISSQLLLNRLVPEMKQAGYEPVVYFPTHKPSKKIPPAMLQDLGFYERRISNEVIYPLLNENGIQKGAQNFSPEQLSSVYNIEVHETDDINAPEFVKKLQNDPNLKGGVSIRCYQKFGENIIGMFEDKGFLWNLHPGILPEYRGVMTLARAMTNGETQTSYSLHAIDKNWDAGPLLDIRPEPLNLHRPMLSNYCDLAPSGVPIIIENMDHFFAGTLPPELPQDPEKAGYWTFPTPEELDDYKDNGLILADGDEMADIYMEAFKGNDEAFNQNLYHNITKTIQAWKNNKTMDSTVKNKPEQFTPQPK